MALARRALNDSLTPKFPSIVALAAMSVNTAKHILACCVAASRSSSRHRGHALGSGNGGVGGSSSSNGAGGPACASPTSCYPDTAGGDAGGGGGAIDELVVGGVRNLTDATCLDLMAWYQTARRGEGDPLAAPPLRLMELLLLQLAAIMNAEIANARHLQDARVAVDLLEEEEPTMAPTLCQVSVSVDLGLRVFDDTRSVCLRLCEGKGRGLAPHRVAGMERRPPATPCVPCVWMSRTPTAASSCCTTTPTARRVPMSR